MHKSLTAAAFCDPQTTGRTIPPVNAPCSSTSKWLHTTRGYPQETGDRFGVDGQRRRAQHDGVAAFLVRGNDFAHVRIDPCLDVAGEQLLAELVEVVNRLAAQIARGPDEQPLELHPAEPVSQ